jgi:hypothetical protein
VQPFSGDAHFDVIRFTTRVALVVGLSLFMQVSPALGANADQVSEVSIRVEAIDDSSRPVPSGLGNRPVLAAFPIIRGALYGSPEGDPVLLEPATFGMSFKLSLALLQDRLKPYAAPLTQDKLSQGLVIEPKDTKLVRAGTFFHDGETGKPMSGAGLHETNSTAQIIFVYFDRPCEVVGEVKSPIGSLVHNFKISRAGLHWLKMTRSGGTYGVEPTPWASSLVMVAPVSELRGK